MSPWCLALQNPPAVVKLVMEAVCIMKNVKPERKPDPSGSGKMVEDYWGPSQKVLSDFKFLDSLRTYDKDNIPPAVIKRIRDKYCPNPEFKPEVVKSASAACEGLCKWIRAMEVYDRVAKVVAPKKIALAEAEGDLAVQMARLNEKRAELYAVLSKLEVCTCVHERYVISCIPYYGKCTYVSHIDTYVHVFTVCRIRNYTCIVFVLLSMLRCS